MEKSANLLAVLFINRFHLSECIDLKRLVIHLFHYSLKNLLVEGIVFEFFFLKSLIQVLIHLLRY